MNDRQINSLIGKMEAMLREHFDQHDPDRIPTLTRVVTTNGCDKPHPEGWNQCTRVKGHLGPCAIMPATIANARMDERTNVGSDSTQKPIDMILHCPKCGLQHIDKDNSDDLRIQAAELGIDREGDRECERWIEDREWLNPPHRSHLCHGCGHIWRPADVPTNGVKDITTKGKADSPREWPGVLKGRILASAERWEKLTSLAGNWQNGSDITVKLMQDDATRECLIQVGEEIETGMTFEQALTGFDKPKGHAS